MPELYATIESYRLYVLSMSPCGALLKLAITNKDDKPLFVLRLYPDKTVRADMAESLNVGDMSAQETREFSHAFGLLPLFYATIQGE